MLSSSVLNACFNLFSVPILLLHFGKEHYGLIGLAFQINLYLVLLDLGMASGNIRFFSRWIAQKQLSRVSMLFQSSLVFYGIIGIINAAILAGVAFFARSIWHLNAADTIIMHRLFYILMASAFIGWISTLFDQFLKANEILGWEERLLIFLKILQLLILYLTVKFNLGVVTYFMLACLGSLLMLPFTLWRISRLKYRVSFMPKYYSKVFKQVLPYSLSVFWVSVFQFSATNIRPLLLSFRSGVAPFADYKILNGISGTILSLSVGFVGILLPMATKAVTLGNTDVKNGIAYNGTKYLTIFLAIIVFGFVLVSKDTLHIYVGDKYDYLITWLNVWVLTMLFSHTSALSSLVFAENKLRPVVYISAFSAITSLILAWFLIPRYQVGGVILSYLYYCISQVTFYYSWYYRKVLKLDVGEILLRSFLKPVISIGICALFTYLVLSAVSLQNKYMRVLVVGSVFIALVVPVIYYFILTISDRTFIKKLLVREKIH